ncbi:MAG: hypothetical protein AAFO69_18205, partial [Bacteroidota bacterium]
YDGLISFDEMEANDQQELIGWKYNRRVAYGGSLRHFMKSVIDNRLAQNGYKAYFKMPAAIDNSYANQDTAITMTRVRVNQASLFKNRNERRMLDFEQDVVIVYYGDLNGERVQLSKLKLKEKVHVTDKGMLETPAAVITYGQMAKEKFAYHLPREYKYQANEEALYQFDEAVVRPFEHYVAGHPVEKLYLHTDKYQYFDGEQIWFKAYTNISDKPSHLSSRLYVQLIHQDQSITKLIVPLVNGVGKGAIPIPDGQVAGNYLIKAYTNYTDTLTDLHFYKKIEIGLESPKPALQGNSLHVAVYPEGGHVVENVENRIAFEVIDDHHQLVNTTLELINEKGKVIQTIFPTWDGRGSFTYIPKGRQPYYLRLKSELSVAGRLLPSPDLNTNMLIKAEEDIVNVIVSNGKSRTKAVHLLITAGDQVVAVRHSKIQNRKVFSIKRSILAEGVNQLTLFDDQYHPLAERLYFKHPEAPSDITLLMNTYTSQTRGPSELIIKGEDQIRSASVSVSHADLSTSDNDENIWLNHYLRPYVNGTITGLENVVEDSEPLRRKLDLLMLINGWRKYDWDQIKQTESTTRDTIEFQAGLNLSGTLTNGRQENAVQN